MLAYAANATTRRDAGRPKLLIPIVAAHVVLIGIVMTARMDVVRTAPPPMIVETYRLPPPPLPPEPTPQKQAKPDPQPAQTTVNPLVDIAPTPRFPTQVQPHDVGTITDGTGPSPLPLPPFIIPEPPHAIVRTLPRLATAEELLRPPYPAAKRDAGIEAALVLRLSIDERGRVTSVEPVGKADPAFLASARAHLIRAWRFDPATEDGKPVASTKTITLRFELGEG
ncbi:energy transducer TonB [Sphingomonas sp. RB1R13]|uniref:energy transducer TonB n=1 Tax=Sphingomonas sp. RB1R13 TaxID=3096159 RepID=UPI002FCC0CBA